eukprot:5267742-Pleurochrysis_carterae.AAC.1
MDVPPPPSACVLAAHVHASGACRSGAACHSTRPFALLALITAVRSGCPYSLPTAGPDFNTYCV